MRSREDLADGGIASQASPSALVHALELLVVFLAYVLSARLGLTLAPLSGFATLVWPPTGIALAALLLRGLRLWPAVLLGAVVANLWNGASFGVAAAIGVGNTLEAMLAMALLARVARMRPELDRMIDVLALVGFAAALSTSVSATIGVAVLQLAGMVHHGQLTETWRAWWVGDALGDLVVAPVLLTWSSLRGVSLSPLKIIEALALGASVVGVSCSLFVLGPLLDPTTFHHPYILFPALIWAALRFGPRGATGTLLLLSIFAIWGTLAGHGPFISARPDLSLLRLQLFMGVASVTTLLLAAASTERTEALRAERDLLAIVSHDLRNPLGALLLRTRNLLAQPAGELGPQARKQAEFVARLAKRMESLIGNVLDAATIRTGHLSLVRAPVDLSALVAEAVDIFRPLADEKSQVLRIEAPSLPAVDGDQERLLQVVSNLLANAVKFAPTAGHITVRAWAQDRWAHCSISDDGPGIDPDSLGRVFEPYWSVGPSRGTGLGLSIVKGIVEAHGGRTFLQSEPKIGTTIGFRLPLADGERATAESAMPHVLSRDTTAG